MIIFVIGTLGEPPRRGERQGREGFAWRSFLGEWRVWRWASPVGCVDNAPAHIFTAAGAKATKVGRVGGDWRFLGGNGRLAAISFQFSVFSSQSSVRTGQPAPTGRPNVARGATAGKPSPRRPHFPSLLGRGQGRVVPRGGAQGKRSRRTSRPASSASAGGVRARRLVGLPVAPASRVCAWVKGGTELCDSSERRWSSSKPRGGPSSVARENEATVQSYPGGASPPG